MLIINADDYGRNLLATDRIISCYKAGSITSTSAMVFMADSRRAADLAREHSIDTGLHLNFTQELTQPANRSLLRNYHHNIASFLTKNKYNFMIYNPAIQKQFDYVFQSQLEEFERLYGISPTHIDGHHHMHLCANMIVGAIIPQGQRVRRNFTFSREEKSILNRLFRAAIDKWLARKYLITDYFFSLSECIKTGRLERVNELAKVSSVELESHPELTDEFEWLRGNSCERVFSNIHRGK